MKRIVVAFLGLLLRPTATLDNQIAFKKHGYSTAVSAPFTDAFRKRVKQVMTQFSVPGVSLAVIDNDNTFEEAFGFAELPAKKATPDTLYYVGSTTKSFTAATLSMLLEDSQNSSQPLSLQSKISSLLPGDFVLPDDYATAHATLEDALTHRLGFPAHDAAYGGGSYTARDATRALRHLSMNKELRSAWEYFNIGYIVCQHVIETLSGSWIGDVHRDRIWKPLGMNNTFIRLQDAQRAVEQDAAVLARGYSWDPLEKKRLEQPPGDTPLVGQGGIISSVRDFAKYVRAMMEMKLPLSEKAQRELVRPRMIFEDPHGMPHDLLAYALGWAVTDFKGHPLVVHSGLTAGFSSRVAYLPSERWGVVQMANSDFPGTFCIDTLFLELLEDRFNVPDSERTDLLPGQENMANAMLESFVNGREILFPDVPAPALPHALPLEAYAGTYANPGYQSWTFAVAEASGRLPVANTSQPVLHADLARTLNFTVDLEHVSGEYFVGYADTVVRSQLGMTTVKAEFRIGANGKVSELGVTGPLLARDQTVWFRKVK